MALLFYVDISLCAYSESLKAPLDVAWGLWQTDAALHELELYGIATRGWSLDSVSHLMTTAMHGLLFFWWAAVVYIAASRKSW